MNTPTVTVSAAAAMADTSWSMRVSDYIELTKPRLSSLVLVTVAVGGLVASWGQPDLWALLHAVIGTGLVAVSASIWNQWLERDTDRLMVRTASRPIAGGRIGRRETFFIGSATLAVGLWQLGWLVNWQSALLGFMTWSLYLFAYTPLKRTTRWNTLVGALPGALPIMIGWTAMEQAFDLRAASMFLIVFLWQFPHFMAIAWKYRQDYGRAGLKMVTVTDPSGHRAGIQAIVGSVALLPVSLVPALVAPPSPTYALIAFAAGMMMVFLSWNFYRNRSDLAAVMLLRASLVYLPLIMVGLACLPLIS